MVNLAAQVSFSSNDIARFLHTWLISYDEITSRAQVLCLSDTSHEDVFSKIKNFLIADFIYYHVFHH